jgi:queuine tRNA-ribosyltransferase
LPLENTQQQLYFQELAEDLRPRISGLALYESASLSIVPEDLGDLPRLSLSEYKTPHDILRDISLGADLVTIPFLSAATDAGIALDFTFPAPASSAESPSTTPRPLAFDMWSLSHTADLSPISSNCQCYTCRKHHRAYIRHLLSAREMLAWTLLQIHNYHTMDLFFAAIRESIEKGTFEEDVKTFERAYEPELPRQTGAGPRYGLFLPLSFLSEQLV